MAASPEAIKTLLTELAEQEDVANSLVKLVAHDCRQLLALFANIDDEVIDQLKELFLRVDKLTKHVDKVRVSRIKHILMKEAIKTANIKLLQTLFIDGKFRHFLQGEQTFVGYKLTVSVKIPKDIEETEDVKEKAVLQRIRFFVDENRRLQPSAYASMLYERGDYKNLSPAQKNEIIDFLREHCDVIPRKKISITSSDVDVVATNGTSKDILAMSMVAETSEPADFVVSPSSPSSSLAGPSTSSQSKLDISLKDDATPDLAGTHEPKVISPRGILPEKLSLLFTDRSRTPGRCSPNRSPSAPVRPSSPSPIIK